MYPRQKTNPEQQRIDGLPRDGFYRAAGRIHGAARSLVLRLRALRGRSAGAAAGHNHRQVRARAHRERQALGAPSSRHRAVPSHRIRAAKATGAGVAAHLLSLPAGMGGAPAGRGGAGVGRRGRGPTVRRAAGRGGAVAGRGGAGARRAAAARRRSRQAAARRRSRLWQRGAAECGCVLASARCGLLFLIPSLPGASGPRAKKFF